MAAKGPGGAGVDVNATVGAMVAAAERRRFFWLFLDHDATAEELEQVLDRLPPSVVPVNLDQGMRLWEAAERRGVAESAQAEPAQAQPDAGLPHSQPQPLPADTRRRQVLCWRSRWRAPGISWCSLWQICFNSVVNRATPGSSM